MTVLTRVASAAVLLAAGLGLAQWVRGLVAVTRDHRARLGFEMMGVELQLAAFAIAIAWALPGKVRDRLGLRPSKVPTSVVVALAIGTLGLSQAVDGVLKLTRALDGSVIVGISRGLQGPELGWSFVIAFFGSAIAPAVAEELLCRGLVQRSLSRVAGPFVGILIASLFFGALHMELVHGVVAATIGLYLGLAAYWADSTRPAIAGHALNNFAALLGSAGLLTMRAPFYVTISSGLAVAFGALFWAWRASRNGSPLGGEDALSGKPSSELQPRAQSTDF